MEIFPAIDLKDGACVRLRQGDFADATLYETDPLLAAKRFAGAGAMWLHVVDLDGAKDGATRQTKAIATLAQNSGLAVQAGGGVRCEEDIDRLLESGVTRVVIGSLAVQQPEKVRAWITRFGGKRIVLALDVRLDDNEEPETLTRGWQESSGIALWDILRLYEGSGLRTVLCTDIGRDGMMTGSNITLYKKMQRQVPSLDIIASGGIGSLDDIRALAKLGLAGAITGKALYEKKFDLAKAIQIGKGDSDAC